jgi:hypothetical protein
MAAGQAWREESIRTTAELDRAIRSIARYFDTDIVYVIGSQAILLSLPTAPVDLRRSVEFDVYPGNADEWQRQHPGLEASEEVHALFGTRSCFHDSFGFYLDGVDKSTATLPIDWRDRSVYRHVPDGARTITGIAPSPQDLCIAKLARGKEKDIQFTEICLRHRFVDIIDLHHLIPKTLIHHEICLAMHGALLSLSARHIDVPDLASLSRSANPAERAYAAREVARVLQADPSLRFLERSSDHPLARAESAHSRAQLAALTTRAKLDASASRIWRDPAGAVRHILDTTGTAGLPLTIAHLERRPASAGPLLGGVFSDWQARQMALAEVPALRDLISHCIEAEADEAKAADTLGAAQRRYGKALPTIPTLAEAMLQTMETSATCRPSQFTSLAARLDDIAAEALSDATITDVIDSSLPIAASRPLLNCVVRHQSLAAAAAAPTPVARFLLAHAAYVTNIAAAEFSAASDPTASNDAASLADVAASIRSANAIAVRSDPVQHAMATEMGFGAVLNDGPSSEDYVTQGDSTPDALATEHEI